MTNKIDLYSKYNETLQLIRAELDPILQNNEEAWIASLPQHVHENVSDNMRGHYKKDLDLLIAMITPENYADCLGCYEPSQMEIPFHQFLLQEVAEQIPAMLCSTLPAIFGEEYVKDMIRFFIGQRFPDVQFTLEDTSEEPWSESDIEFFQQEIGEIGVRKLQKIEVGAKVAYQAYKSITGEFVCGATASDIIEAVKHRNVTGAFPDIEWLQQRS